MEYSVPSFVMLILSLVVATRSDPAIFNVLDYGAVGDGRSDDTNAFAKAWQDTCAWSSSPVMQVPSNKAFLIHPLRFIGPCNSSTITVQIDGTLVAPSNPSEWECGDQSCQRWINFDQVDGLTVHGQGVIDARGRKWWARVPKKKRPTTLEISESNNVYLSGLRFKDSPQMHVVLNRISSPYVSNVTIEAPGRSPNTDGIHVTGCTNAVIDHSRIGTGDDCISIVDGSSFVTASNIICGPGHGISIGSLGKNGAKDEVEYVRVSDVVFVGAKNGARIKTWQGGRGYARHIIFERILCHNTRNPIIIDQFYCDHQRCVPSELAVQISNVTFRQILGTSKKKTAVKLACSEAVPCRDIVVDDIHILRSDGEEVKSECRNMRGRAEGDKVPGISCMD